MENLGPDFDETDAGDSHYREITYDDITGDSELSTRPHTAGVITGQASFLALALRLRVPILDYAANQRGNADILSAGFGASFDVSRSLHPLGRKDDAPSITDPNRLWFGNKANESLIHTGRFVSKKIRTNNTTGASDASHLAAITNEMRILSSEFLRDGSFNVRLLCLAWDESPSFGRYWPRLLLECADHGNLHDYLRAAIGMIQWATKVSLALDVLCGLKELHYHSVVHGDLRLENVLVFAEISTNDSEVKVKAKLCDFGFSMILSDYKRDAIFQDRLGTPPWNAPELAYGLPVPLSKLAGADTYSFGLLLSRICLNGRSPFEGMTMSQVDKLKTPGDTAAMCEIVMKSFAQSCCLKKHQVDAIGLIMLLTLSYDINARVHDHTISALLCIFMVIYSDAHCDYLEMADRERSTHNEGHQETALSARTASSSQVDEVPTLSGWFSSFQTFFGSPARGGLESLAQETMMQRVHNSLQNFTSSYKWFTSPIIQALLQQMGLSKDRHDKLLQPSPIAALPITSIIGDFDDFESYDCAQARLPNFEDSRACQFSTLSRNVLCETIKDLIGLASAQSAENVAGVASYQLALAHFYGFGVEKNITSSLNWLHKAAELGHPHAICNAKNVHEAISRSIPDGFPCLHQDHLKRLIGEELTTSMIQILHDRLHPQEQFPALRWWAKNDSPKYRLYSNSSDIKHRKVLFFLAWNIINLPEETGEPKEYHFLKNINYHNLLSETPFRLEDREAFVKQMRSVNCTEGTENGMTMLQYASAKGDSALAHTLLHDLHAKVDSTGRTPGFTPLWIAALCGHYELLQTLLNSGADIRRRDLRTNRSILHFLNQFADEKSIEWILQRAAKARMNVKEYRSVDGSLHNVLLSTFIGWDFSGTHAAFQLLRSWNADPIETSKADISAMQMCVRTLDTQLLMEMLASSRKRSQSTDDARRMVDQKVATLQYLFTLQPMFLFGVLGRFWRERLLVFIKCLDVDSPEVLSGFESSKYTYGTNPLISACWDGNSYLLDVLLEIELQVTVDTPDSHGSTPLHWAIERRSRECIGLLLKKNAQMTIRNENGFNVAHVAAVHFPSFLPELAEIYASSKGSPSDLLEVQNLLGFTPYALAVVEGSHTHLINAERLRERYDLRYDDMCATFEEEGKMTLMGHIVVMCSHSFSLAHPRQVSYLLSLEPKPKFTCTTTGMSLIHLVARGVHNAMQSDNLIAYDTLEKILAAYPDPAQVNLMDRDHHTALHYASNNTDLPIAEILRDHMRKQRYHLEVNARSRGGTTPLDYVGSALKSLELDRIKDKPIFDSIKAKTFDMYRLLRTMGGLKEFELLGITHIYAARMQNEMRKEELLDFIQQTEGRYGIHSVFFDGPTRSNKSHILAEFVERESGPISSNLIGTREVSWIVCLVWLYDRFVLYAFQLKENDIERVKNLVLSYRAKALRQFGTFERQAYPWATDKCYDTFEGRPFEWSRSGRVWTPDEKSDLRDGIFQDWKDTFRGPRHTFVASRHTDQIPDQR